MTLTREDLPFFGTQRWDPFNYWMLCYETGSINTITDVVSLKLEWFR